MKQTILLSIFLLAFYQFSHAQKNCCNSLDLVTATLGGFQVNETNGSGEVDDVSCSCLNGEGGSTWFSFSSATGGTLELLIQPKTPPGADFDFSIWEQYCPCTSPLPGGNSPVVCNSTIGNGPTGIATDPLASFGVPASASFSTTITILKDRNYFLLVSNVANNGIGFTITVGGTASIGFRLPPPGSGTIQGPSEICAGGSATFSIPPVTGANNYAWEVTPGGITQNGPQPFHSLNFPTVGTYQVCVSASGPLLGCFATLPSCMMVTVDELPYPAGFESGYVCTGDVYVAGNGEAFFYGGVFDVVHESWQGCDSVVILSLTQVVSDFNVIVKQVCPGECVEFNGETICDSGTYDEVLTNQYGCDSTTQLLLISVPLETIITGAASLTCNTTSIVLSGATSIYAANPKYTWRKGNTVVGSSPTLTVTTGGTYTLTIESTVDNHICEESASVTVLQNTTPPTAAATGGFINCINTQVTLQGSSTTPNVTYKWTGPGGYTSTLQNPVVSVPGNYVLTVTGPNGCTKTATAMVVGDITPPTATAVGGDITCIVSSVTLSGSSTTPGSTFSWVGPTGGTFSGPNPTVAAPGNYTLTVTGPNGCTKTAVATVSENKVLPNAAAAANGTINCNASSVLLSGAGSSTGSQYNYLWTTINGNISDPTNLTPTANAPGNYLLTVTNSTNGCTATASTTVIQRTPVATAITASNDVNCFGESSGSATVSANGGDGNFTYAWSNGATTATASNLIAGNYSVVVTDGDGCTSSQSVVLTQPTQLLVNAAATPQSTFGVDDGTATANPSGGTGNYTYVWNNGGTSQSISDLAPGNYTVVVTDENGCTASQTVTVSESDCIVKANIDKTDVTCPGANNGAATINLENAQAPLSFVWSNGETTQTISGLSGGTYSVSSTDANGCSVVTTVIIDEPLTFNANATATNLTAINSNDGTATANPTGGTGTYTYLWSNGETNETIAGLVPGNYTVVVTDENGCQAEQTVTIEPFDCGLAASIISSDISCNGANDGQATLTLLGGTAPFTYAWSNGEITSTLTGLAAGTYIGTATDDTGCPAVAQATIAEPSALGVEVTELVEAECGASNGELTIIGTGGTPGYAFFWDNGETTTTISGLAAGTYTVAVTDANGCEDNFEIELGVDDDVPPIVLTQNITLVLDENGQATAIPSEVDNGSTDDCAIATFNLDQADFGCSDLGENTVALTVTDVGGNSVTGTAIVTVVDFSAPELILQSVTLELDANGNAILTPQQLDNASTDNCGITSWTLSQTSFGCDDAGVNTVEISATDASGNVTTATVEVNVMENTPPDLDCPDGLVLSYCDAVAEFNIIATDNCAGNVALTQTSGLPSGSEYPLGNTTVSFTATDVSGNTTSCTFVITLPPAMVLSFDLEDVSCFGENDGSATVTPTGGSQPYTYSWITGGTSSTVTGLVAGEYSVSVTDAGGCAFAQAINIDEPADFVTTLVTIVNSTNNQQNGSIEVTVSGGVTPYTYVWTNAAGATIGTSEDISGLAAGTYTLTATDANGCESQSGYTIQNTNAVTESGLDSHVLLYPNPASGWVTLELVGLANVGGVEVTAFDVTGRLALRHSAVGDKQLLDFTNKPSGVYLLKILVGNEVLTKRLVVNK